MSEIRPTSNKPKIPPTELQKTKETGKSQSDVKGTADATETQAASVAASQSQNTEAIKNTLIQVFGEKIGKDAFNTLCAEAKKGKDLTFDVVKSAILDAAKKNKETVTQAQLEALKGAFPKDETSTQAPEETNYLIKNKISDPDYDPNQFRHDLSKIRKRTDKLIEAMKEAVEARETKQELAKQEKIKEKQDAQMSAESRITSKLLDDKRRV